MNDLTEYSWWGESNAPPANLKTKKQLAEIGLAPVKPVGIIYTKKYNCLLYDVNNPDSVRQKKLLTEKQLQALEKARKKQQYRVWLREYGEYYQDRNYAVEWAREVFNNTKNFVILDTETTGLHDAEIVQIGVTDLEGKILLNSLCKPSIPIPAEASAIHGIYDKDVEGAFTFVELYPQIKEVLEGKEIIIYNSEFDVKILNYCCKFYRLPKLQLEKRTHCAMGEYARYVGEWSNYYDDYKFQPLNGGHNAISDCLACLNLVEEMATSEIYSLEELFEQSFKS